MAEENMLKILPKLIAGLLSLCIILAPLPKADAAFTITDEREVGEKLLYSVRSAFPLLDDPDITQYLTLLGKQVLEVAGIQYFDYHYFVIDDKDFNAFAAPSGLIFFYAGLIATMNSEDELVSVLAHEIGHIVKRHLASRIETGTYTGLASLGLAIAAIAFGGAATPALLTGALATGQSLNLHFSRIHEEEADALAYGWMKKMGRDPEGQASMLESMRRIARYRSEKLPQYLLTHPNPEVRLDYIESLIDADKQIAPQSLLYDEKKEFAFLRFKYRIMSKSETSEPRSVKAFFASKLSDARATKFQQVMANYGLSQVALRENDVTRALALLDQVIAFFPDQPILLADKGVALFSAGKLSEAEDALRKALDSDNSNMYATHTLGKICYRTGRLMEAKTYFTTVSYQAPEYADAYFELGQIATDQKEQGTSLLSLGKFHLYQGKLKLAEENFERVSRNKNFPEKTREEADKMLEKIKQLKK